LDLHSSCLPPAPTNPAQSLQRVPVILDPSADLSISFAARVPHPPRSTFPHRRRTPIIAQGPTRVKRANSAPTPSPQVAVALVALGNAFLSHPESADLRAALSSGRLGATDYFRQLVGLALRLLFLRMAAERQLLPPAGAAAVHRLQAANASPAAPAADK